MVVMKKIYFIGLSLLMTYSIFAQSGKENDLNEENTEINSRFIDRKAIGFYNIMHISLLSGAGQSDRPANYPSYGIPFYDYIVPSPIYYYPVKSPALTIAPSFTITNGYMFNERWAAGAGIGFEIFNYNLFPLFAELRYTKWDHEISPFVVIKSGYSFAGFKARHYDELYLYWPPYYTSNARLRHYGGFMINPEVGVKLPLSENSDLLFTAAYNYQMSKSIVKKEFGQSQFEEWEHKEEISRLSFGVAIMFR